MDSKEELKEYKNTDRLLFTEKAKDWKDEGYMPSISVTAKEGIMMNVGGKCITKTIREWHDLTRAEPELRRLDEEELCWTIETFYGCTEEKDFDHYKPRGLAIMMMKKFGTPELVIDVEKLNAVILSMICDHPKEWKCNCANYGKEYANQLNQRKDEFLGSSPREDKKQ